MQILKRCWFGKIRAPSCKLSIIPRIEFVQGGLRGQFGRLSGVKTIDDQLVEVRQMVWDAGEGPVWAVFTRPILHSEAMKKAIECRP
jgi:hypothetical protein